MFRVSRENCLPTGAGLSALAKQRSLTSTFNKLARSTAEVEGGERGKAKEELR